MFPWSVMISRIYANRSLDDFIQGEPVDTSCLQNA